MYPQCFLRHRVLSGKPHHPARCGLVIGLCFPCLSQRGLPSRHKPQSILLASISVGFGYAGVAPPTNYLNLIGSPVYATAQAVRIGQAGEGLGLRDELISRRPLHAPLDI